uniref:Uncharacterized protein n=1 Tax=Anopheles funestus TaxID=62324 RepID=A0A4Y0BFF1_ANOFN
MWNRQSVRLMCFAVLCLLLSFEEGIVTAAPTSDCGTPTTNGTHGAGVKKASVPQATVVSKPNVPEIDPFRWLVSKSGSIFKG